MKIGMLTSGGDCPGLDATMRAFVRYVTLKDPKSEIIGFIDGYTGLINNDYRKLDDADFAGLLLEGGTMLGSKRQPFKMMTVADETGQTKLEKMVKNYKKDKLDCLVTLGGCGTHKTAALSASEGLNVVGLPKTIDNDLWGTDCTFGFHTAVDRASETIDRLVSTARSHSRIFLAEVMGNKVGWLTLYAGVASGVDMIILPEIPYDEKKVIDFLKKKIAHGDGYGIIAIAEGALTKEEAKMKRADWLAARQAKGIGNATGRLAAQIQEATGVETRTQIIGYVQRGGTPDAYDRDICTWMGAYAGKLVLKKTFGVTVALNGNKVTYNALSEIAGKSKQVTPDDPMVQAARSIGISFGD